ncbi:MAG TPA: hypothetical protein VMM13_09585 [Euzebya sp.]|nr:hypothetical protein [Euzebya sp.]
MTLTTVLPLLAACVAIPQLLPQLLRIRRTDTTAGVSVAWAGLTAVSNLGWLTYFTTTALWTAAVPSSSSAVIAIAIVWSLRSRGVPVRHGTSVAAAWLVTLAVTVALTGPSGLGAVLTIAFVVQVAPSLRAAWSTPDPEGISRGTWVLIGVEVACWGLLGVLAGRPPLIALGLTGSGSALAMLWLSRPTRSARREPLLPHPLGGVRSG